MTRLRYLFLLSLFSLNTQAQDLFSINAAPDAYRVHTLHHQPAFSDILLTRYSAFAPVFPDRFYRNGFTAYRPYLNLPSRYFPLDTMRARTFLHLMLGTKRDQLLFLDHHQRLGKFLTGGLHYHSIVSPGFLRSQLAKNKSFGAFIQMQQSRYSGTVSYNTSKVNAAENGGITDTVLASPPTRSELEVLPVRLTGANVSNRYKEIRFDQSFRITDSVHAFRILLNSKLTGEGWSYRETSPVSELYPVVQDTLLTYDTTFINILTLNPALQYLFQRDSLSSLNVEAGMAFNFSEERITIRRQEPQWQEPYLRISAKRKDHSAGVSVRLASGNRFAGNYLLSGSYGYSRPAAFLSGVSAGIESAMAAPAATDVFYHSNHFTWNNEFVSEKYLRANLNVTLLRNHVSIFWNRSRFSDKVILDSSRRMRQLTADRFVTETGISARADAGKWIFMLRALYRPEIMAEIQQPENEVYFRIAYGNRFFKNALNAEGGISGFITSEFYTPFYEPALGRYRSQYNELTGGTPVLNAFVNLRIRTAVISVIMENAAYGWLGDPYYSGPRNPAPPRVLRLSVQWLLAN